MSSAPSLDLSAIPKAQREAVLAVLRERDALREANKRLEHLASELNQVVHGKKSDTLSEDERQLALRISKLLSPRSRRCRTKRFQPRPVRGVSGPPGPTEATCPRGSPGRAGDRAGSLDCPCGCGTMHRIGKDRSERLDIVPAQLRVIATIRP